MTYVEIIHAYVRGLFANRIFVMEAQIFYTVLAKLAFPYSLLLLVPGPNWLVVLRVNMTPSWVRCLTIAGGIATGAFLAVAISALSAGGLISVAGIERVAPLVLATIMTSSAVKLVLSAQRTRAMHAVPNVGQRGRVFGLGLATALSNPLSIPFFASFYAATPEACNTTGTLAGATMISIMALLWFTAIGRLTVSPFVRRASHPARVKSVKYLLAAAMLGYAILLIWRYLA